jgi:hypothetical protein
MARGTLFDRHRDMRLDVDNMSYEVLLFLLINTDIATAVGMKYEKSHEASHKFYCGTLTIPVKTCTNYFAGARHLIGQGLSKSTTSSHD